MLGLLALAACGGGGDEVDCDPIAATLVSRIEVSPATPVLADGESLQLSATAFSCDGTRLVVPSFTWQSADATTVSVNASGMAVGVKVGGPVSVTAAAQGKQGSTRVSVAPRAVASVRVEPATANVAVGRTSTFTARAFDAQGGELLGRTATWSSANSAVASVTQAGAVSGVTVGGPVAITATIDGQAGSSQVSVVNAAVASVTVTPPTATVGAGASVQLTAVLRDDAGNILTGRAVLWTTTDAVRTSVSQTGLVTGLVPGGPATILATSEGRSGESQVTVVPGAATRLVFTVQPRDVVAGRLISPDVKVEVRDALGNRVPNSTASVTMSLGVNPGPGVLTGTTTVNAIAGVATFTNLRIRKAASGYTLTAVSTGLSDGGSSSFSVIPAPPASQRFSTQPTSIASGTEFSPAVAVEVLDSAGNRVTNLASTVTLALQPDGNTLNGVSTGGTVNGVATFPGLSVRQVGTGYTLVATSAGVPAATSSPFSVTPGVPAALVFTEPPSTVVAGAAIAPAIRVEVLDAQGNLVSTAASAVTLSLSSNPGLGTLSGTLVTNAVDGVATFSDISVNLAADGYTLAADSPGLAGTVSAGFDVTPGVAVRLGFATPPGDILEGSAFDPVVAVEAQDAFGNRATGHSGSVSLQLRNETGGGAGAGNMLVGGGARPFVQGLAVFTGMTVNFTGIVLAPREFMVRTQGSIETVTSGTFTVSPF